MFKFLLLIFPLYLSLSTIASATEPTTLLPFKVTYTLIAKGLEVGEVKRQLSLLDDKTYKFNSSAKTKGIARLFVKDEIYEETTFQQIGTTFRPNTYSYKRTGKEKNNRTVTIKFNWDKNKAVNNINGDPWAMNIPRSSKDKLLYYLSLMKDLKLNKANPYTYTIADGGKIKKYTFETAGEETLNSELGTFKTIIIKRVNDKRNLTLWSAPELDYIPLKIEQTEKDGTLLQYRVTSYKSAPIH